MGTTNSDLKRNERVIMVNTVFKFGIHVSDRPGLCVDKVQII